MVWIFCKILNLDPSRHLIMFSAKSSRMGLKTWRKHDSGKNPPNVWQLLLNMIAFTFLSTILYSSMAFSTAHDWFSHLVLSKDLRKCPWFANALNINFENLLIISSNSLCRALNTFQRASEILVGDVDELESVRYFVIISFLYRYPLLFFVSILLLIFYQLF